MNFNSKIKSLYRRREIKTLAKEYGIICDWTKVLEEKHRKMESKLKDLASSEESIRELLPPQVVQGVEEGLKSSNEHSEYLKLRLLQLVS